MVLRSDRNLQNCKKSLDNNIHAGHRERLFDLAFENGLDRLTKIQTLETILCYIFPRGDVNPLAHRLLDHFGSLSAVMEADVNELMTVKGMGKVSARKLHLLNEINLVYTLDKMKVNPQFNTFADIYDYLENLLRFKNVEELYFLAIGANKVCINTKLYARGTINMVGISLNDLVLYLASTKAHALVIAHNHPNGSCKPSPQDESAFEKLKNMLNMANCQLLDSFIIGSDGIYSMENHAVARIYMEEEYKNQLDFEKENLEYLQQMQEEREKELKLNTN